MTNKSETRVFLRYIVIGGGLFLIDLSIFMLATTFFKIDPVTSQLTSRAIGATIGFVSHKKITFKKRRKKQRFHVAKQGVGYIALSLFTFFLSPVILLLFLTWTNQQKIVAKIFTEVILVLITFFSMRYIFKPMEE